VHGNKSTLDLHQTQFCLPLYFPCPGTCSEATLYTSMPHWMNERAVSTFYLIFSAPKACIKFQALRVATLTLCTQDPVGGPVTS